MWRWMPIRRVGCPDAQWRLIIALSRYGGLRCPSEHLALTWGDVDWERNRLNVRSPKTEHYRGGESRAVPLFPELRPYLEEAFELAEPGTQHVVTRYRDSSANLRTQFLRIIRRAGVESWPKLFHNLRASRQTELENQFPSHVVCDWMGNSHAVARKHYLQTTEEHFARAGVASGARGGASVVQRVVHHATEANCNELQEMQKASGVAANSSLFPRLSDSAEYPLPESNRCCRTENPES